jgi:hypothetical protein
VRTCFGLLILFLALGCANYGTSIVTVGPDCSIAGKALNTGTIVTCEGAFAGSPPVVVGNVIITPAQPPSPQRVTVQRNSVSRTTDGLLGAVAKSLVGGLP